ncbi:beta-1,3-galactosyltransferase 5-like [Mytilus trossulus]|uniref:beta-1,3-galactosyltransferase 5-like n=1 Tax=Mytilus trossulus TaxID=6551 RepID=UPI003005F82E
MNSNTRHVISGLLPAIVLLGVLLPMLLYTNLESMKIYLTTIKLIHGFDNVINETTHFLNSFDSSANLLKSQHQHSIIQDVTRAPIKKAEMPVTVMDALNNSQIGVSKSKERRLKCDGCFSKIFKFEINNADICKTENANVKLLILITSSPQNNLARTAIRETWLKHAKMTKEKIRYIFLIGESPETEEIRKENSITKDIVLGNFKDSYSNLTLKTIMGYQWTVKHCNNAKFVMKTDDDMYVNIPGLIQVIKKNDHVLQTAVGGYCFKIGQPHRDRKSKWYASLRSYPQETYPGFCSGTGYVTSLNVVTQIVKISRHVPFFHLEDVYISLCIQQLGLKLYPLEGFMEEHNSDPCFYKDEKFITAHKVPLRWMRHIWQTPCLKGDKKSKLD